MREIRQLTTEDMNLSSTYLEIFNSRLDDISNAYTSQQIEDARKTYRRENLEAYLRDGSGRQFRAHFTDNFLDGILIEGERDSHIQGKKESLIYWIMAKEDGIGIGSEMLDDCITRASESGKVFIYLSVAEGNLTKRFYERKGFVEDRKYGENDNMCLMVLPIEENLRGDE